MKEKNEKDAISTKRKSQLEYSRYDFFIYEGAPVIPGIVRLRDAPYYLGMNKTYFRDQVQPYLTRIPIDKKGIGFNRMELDRWIAYAQATLGQPPKSTPPWEIPNQSSPIRTSIEVQHSKLPRKITVQKKPLPGKPTAQDLEDLVNKMVLSENHRQKIK